MQHIILSGKYLTKENSNKLHRIIRLILSLKIENQDYTKEPY